MTQLYMDACTKMLPAGEAFTFDTCARSNRSLMLQAGFGGFIRELEGLDGAMFTLQATTLGLQAQLLLLVTNQVRPRVNMAFILYYHDDRRRLVLIFKHHAWY